MNAPTPEGRRERKKLATRHAIVAAAMPLFLERGFDRVSVKEIADEVDISPTTVFSYFPQKETIVFHDEADQHDRLIAAIEARTGDTSISHALKAHFRFEFEHFNDNPYGVTRRELLELVENTPSLQDYASQMWFRREGTLAGAIAHALSLSQPTDEIRAYAGFALQLQLMASGREEPLSLLDAGFRVLDRGWVTYLAETGRQYGGAEQSAR